MLDRFNSGYLNKDIFMKNCIYLLNHWLKLWNEKYSYENKTEISPENFFSKKKTYIHSTKC
jgi:hypothetical protein